MRDHPSYTPDTSWGHPRLTRHHTIHKRTARRLLALIAIGAVLAAGGTATARADGILDTHEAVYVDLYGLAICRIIDAAPTPRGVMVAAQAVMNDGFDAYSAADVVNASVSTLCPSHWPLLVAIGEAARGERVGGRLV